MAEINTNAIRKDQIKTLINSNKAILVGDSLVVESVLANEPRQKSLGTFGLNPETTRENPLVWFCTPFGVPLFEADDLHKFALETTKKNFLKNLDILLGNNVPKSFDILGA